MSQATTPRVFVSAASSDLRTARKVVNEALTRIECLPVEESIFGTEYGQIREMLKRKIASCQAVIHLVGRDYGGEATLQSLPAGQSRCSWTQLEFSISKELGKKLYVFVCDDAFPFDMAPGSEPEETTALQIAHRKAVLADKLLWHAVQDTDDLRRQVENLKVPLDEVRTELTRVDEKLTTTGRKLSRSIVGIAALVLLSGGIGVFLTGQQRNEVRSGIDALQTQIEALTRGMRMTSNADVLGQVTAGEPQARKLAELTEKLESLVRQLAVQIGTTSPGADDELRLRRAAAAIQHTRGLIHLENGEVDAALGEFDHAVESYTALVMKDGRKDFEDILARSLHDRGVILSASAATREKADQDLNAAATIFKKLVEDEGRTGLKDELDQTHAALEKVNDLAGGEGTTPTAVVRNPEEGEPIHSTQRGVVIQPSGSSAIVVKQLTGAPVLNEVQVLKAGDAGQVVHIAVQSTKNVGTPMLVEPGMYDIIGYCGQDKPVTIIRNLEMKAEQLILIDPNVLIGRIVVSRRKIEGLAIKKITVVAAGTNLTVYHNPVQESTEFGTPLLVYAGERYDVAVVPVDGQAVKIAWNITAKAGQLTNVDKVGK